VIVSSAAYNAARRDLIIMAVTSQARPAGVIGEVRVKDWKGAGLIKPSLHQARHNDDRAKARSSPARTAQEGRAGSPAQGDQQDPGLRKSLLLAGGSSLHAREIAGAGGQHVFVLGDRPGQTTVLWTLAV
jgi:hypothetical protein